MNLERCPSATGQAQVNVLRNPHLHMSNLQGTEEKLFATAQEAKSVYF